MHSFLLPDDCIDQPLATVGDLIEWLAKAQLPLGMPLATGESLLSDLHTVRINELRSDGQHFIVLIPDEAVKPHCDHEWIDIRNEVVVSGEMCHKCGTLRAGNEATS